MSENFPTQYENPSDSPGFMLWRVTNAWQRAMREALKETGLTHTQFVLLASLVKLHETESNITQAVLSHFAGVDIMMTSQVLRTLQTKGCINRASHPTDSRAKVITPTTMGITLIQQAVQLVDAKDAQFFAVLETKLPEFISNLQQLAL
jgi:DNA-binding MarR family transcriptional regulator